MRRDVARGPGIGVLPPGTTDAVAAFEDDDVVDAGLGQRVHDREATEARTEHGDFDAIPHGRVPDLSRQPGR